MCCLGQRSWSEILDLQSEILVQGLWTCSSARLWDSHGKCTVQLIRGLALCDCAQSRYRWQSCSAFNWAALWRAANEREGVLNNRAPKPQRGEQRAHSSAGGNFLREREHKAKNREREHTQACSRVPGSCLGPKQEPCSKAVVPCSRPGTRFGRERGNGNELCLCSLCSPQPCTAGARGGATSRDHALGKEGLLTADPRAEARNTLARSTESNSPSGNRCGGTRFPTAPCSPARATTVEFAAPGSSTACPADR